MEKLNDVYGCILLLHELKQYRFILFMVITFISVEFPSHYICILIIKHLFL